MGLATAIIIFVALVVDFLFLPAFLLLADKRDNDGNAATSSSTAANDAQMAETNLANHKS
jgi:hypothetical protein